MQFEYDPERLIEEVKKRPGIWDFDNVEYRTKNTRHKLWNEVVNELLQTNVKVSKSEMRELELQLQKKWKSIRDCFQKYIANPSRTRRPYLYCKQLQFLLKDQDLPTENATSDSEEGPKFKVKKRRKLWKQTAPREDEDTTEEEENFDEDNRSNNSDDDVAVEIPVTKATKCKPPQEFVFANVDLQPVKEGEDPDKLFFLSLLPHFKAIPEEFRLNVKMELMQVLQNAHYNTARGNKLI
ncbi:uncharacterized protein LOC134648135 [Cydia amplana]|uniref:uncharacterized protein LOC134648135 n=1 Tax=Cydia amplana TaxID=1869771 RepID=UPI002FE54836